MMAVTKNCVTPTDLAALLEGSLTGEERDRAVEHLNRCPDCFERYIGTARLLDAIEEEEAALVATDGNRAVEPRLLPVPETLKERCRKLLDTPISLPWRACLALAAILAFVGVNYLWKVYVEETGRPTASERAALLRRWVRAGGEGGRPPEVLSPELPRVFSGLPNARQEAFDEEAFDEEIRRMVRGQQGNGAEGMTCRRQAASRPILRGSRIAFQLGAHWVDLDPVLRSKSTTLTEHALRNLREVLPESLPADVEEAFCSQLLLPQAPEPEEIDACRRVIELGFRRQPEFVLGRWTEATRLAIAAGRDRFFTDTRVREFPKRLLELDETRWDNGVRAELERAGKLLEGGLAPGEGQALEAVLRDLACFYEMGE